MVRKCFIVGVTLVLLGLVVGCGIPQDQYNAVIAERDSVKAQLASTAADRDGLKTLLSGTVTERDSFKSQLTTTTTERDTAKNQVTSLQKDASTLQAGVTDLQVNFKMAQTALDTAKSDSAAFKSDANSLYTGLQKKVKAYTLIMDYWSAAGKYAAGSLSQSDLTAQAADFVNEFSVTLDAVGSPDLSQAWKDALAFSAKNDSEGFVGKLIVIMDSLTGLINKDVAALGAKLK